jgi:hypothetical protein
VVDVVEVLDDVVVGRDVVGATVVRTTVVVGAGRVVVGAGRVVGVVGRVVVGFGGAVRVVVGATVVVVVDVVVVVEVVVDPGTAFGTLPRFGGGELGTGSVVADVGGRVGTVAKVPGTVVVVAAW